MKLKNLLSVSACASFLFNAAPPSASADTILWMTPETTTPTQDYSNFVDKIAFFLIDASGSISEDDKTIILNAIIDSIETPEVSVHLNSGNHTQFVFISFGDGDNATIEKVITVNNADDAKHLITEFFMGVDGQTPVQFQTGTGTNMAPAIHVMANYLREREGLYQEANTVIFTDTELSDANSSESALKHAIDDFPKLQVSCAALTSAVAMYEQFVERFQSPRGQCARLDTYIEMRTRTPQATQFTDVISDALRYTQG